jgi:hypothetical protein
VTGISTAILLASVASIPFQDAWIRVDLPKGWSIEGESGEYMLESDLEDDQDMASLLILQRDTERTMEEVLADIEEQFLSTGLFILESSEEKSEDDTAIHIRRYRKTAAAGDTTEAIHHQYFFWRGDVQVLLQVEAADKSSSPERLFKKVFKTLEVLTMPEPFSYEDYWDDPELEEGYPEEIPEDFEEEEADSLEALEDEEGDID